MIKSILKERLLRQIARRYIHPIALHADHNAIAISQRLAEPIHTYVSCVAKGIFKYGCSKAVVADTLHSDTSAYNYTPRSVAQNMNLDRTDSFASQRELLKMHENKSNVRKVKFLRVIVK